MPNLFIFTAGNTEAQAHLDSSIKRPIDSAVVFQSFKQDNQDELQNIHDTAGGFYAWGATPGSRNISQWNSMKTGDNVLCVFKNKYKYHAKVLGKYHNKELASQVWGTDQNGNTWEYMYFLTKPKEIDIHVGQLGNYLNQRYMGFTKISDKRINSIFEKYGSLDEFINQVFLKSDSPLISNPNFWWVNQGRTYKAEHDGSFIWAPQKNEQGQEFFYWTNVSKVKKGDIIFHYVKGNIESLSIALSNGYQVSKPDSIPKIHWQDQGWRVDLQYYDLSKPIQLDQVASKLKELNIEGSPINKNNGVNQGYLFSLNYDAAQKIINEMDNNDLPDEIKALFHNKADITTLQSQFKTYLDDIGYYFKSNDIEAFISSILAKPFVILTGNSGSGKTKLAKLFAAWLSSELANDPQRYRIVPVGADWTDSRNVIGFVNHLKTEDGSQNGRPVFQGTPVLDLIISAQKDPQRPYFLILDEMNLSHVERYFSDFLSAMESHEIIPVHQENGQLLTSSGFKVSPHIPYPENLYVIGTVNIDETTYMFSPKVLDRANVLEFSLEENDLENYFQQPRKGIMRQGEKQKASNGLPEAYQELSLQSRELSETTIPDPPDIEKVRNTLQKFFNVLKKSGFEFAYRTVEEILRYVRVSHAIQSEDEVWSWSNVMDRQILQKILPKLHGSRRRLETALVALTKLCENNNQEEALKFFGKNNAKLGEFEENPEYEGKYVFPASRRKLVQMINALRRDQFVSFIQ